MSAFHGASDFTIKDSMFINYGSKGAVMQGPSQQPCRLTQLTGLEKLRTASIPGAAHDSSERYPPPICHPGTREDYIERLTKWGSNAYNHAECVMWVGGPAGVGKSAVAQSCAEALHSKKKLGASFFFSRPNHRDDPDRFFTSLASQLAGKHDAYGTHLDHEIQRDPDLVQKSLPHQFHNLFVVPFTKPAIKEEVAEQVTIVDGLDECVSKEAQVAIIKIVAESVRARTTPLLWIFLSRLEPKIIKAFELPDIKSVSQQIDLPVSREIDQQILRYLADKLQEIGREHDLTLPWPSEKEVWALVDFSAGLFACAHAIIFFVGAESPAGPVELLHAVLELAKHSATRSSNHRLSALDEFYTLVMERVSPTMLQTVQWILLTTRVPDVIYAHQSANLSGLSELQLRTACGYLHSVMKIGTRNDARITFYHASFMDFLEDPIRSGRFHIWSYGAILLLEEVLHHLDRARFDRQRGLQFDLTWPGVSELECYSNHRSAFFKILSSVTLDNNAPKSRALVNFDFRKFSFDIAFVPVTNKDEELELLMRNVYD